MEGLRNSKTKNQKQKTFLAKIRLFIIAISFAIFLYPLASVAEELVPTESESMSEIDTQNSESLEEEVPLDLSASIYAPKDHKLEIGSSTTQVQKENWLASKLKSFWATVVTKGNQPIKSQGLIYLSNSLNKHNHRFGLERIFSNNVEDISTGISSSDWKAVGAGSAGVVAKTSGIVLFATSVGMGLGSVWSSIGASVTSAAKGLATGAKAVTAKAYAFAKVIIPTVTSYASKSFKWIEKTVPRVQKVFAGFEKISKSISGMAKNIYDTITKVGDSYKAIDKLTGGNLGKILAGAFTAVGIVASTTGVMDTKAVTTPTKTVKTTEKTPAKNTQKTAAVKTTKPTTAANKTATGSTTSKTADAAKVAATTKVVTDEKQKTDAAAKKETVTTAKETGSTIKQAAAKTATTAQVKTTTTTPKSGTSNTSTPKAAAVSQDTKTALNSYKDTIKNLAGALAKVPKGVGNFVASDMPRFLTGGYYDGEGNFQEKAKPTSIIAMLAWGTVGALSVGSLAVYVMKRLRKEQEMETVTIS